MDEPHERKKARRLLEMLRMRTEARGATPAEAAQAANLAEKLIKRFGLQSDGKAKQETELDSKVFPTWARVLAWGICDRFELEGQYTRQKGKRAAAIFLGAEHNASVGCWLFDAVATDLQRSACNDARAAGLKGARLVVFRNAFLRAAAWEVYRRLNAKQIERRRIEAEQSAAAEGDTHEPRRKAKKKPRSLSKADQRAEQIRTAAMLSGIKAGREVAISADVIGDDSETLALEHAR